MDVYREPESPLPASPPDVPPKQSLSVRHILALILFFGGLLSVVVAASMLSPIAGALMVLPGFFARRIVQWRMRLADAGPNFARDKLAQETEAFLKAAEDREIRTRVFLPDVPSRPRVAPTAVHVGAETEEANDLEASNRAAASASR